MTHLVLTSLVCVLAAALIAGLACVLVPVARRRWTQQTAAVSAQITALAAIRRPAHHARKHFRRAA